MKFHEYLLHTFLLPSDATFEAALGPNATLLLPALLANASEAAPELSAALDDLLLSHVLPRLYPQVGVRVGGRIGGS